MDKTDLEMVREIMKSSFIFLLEHELENRKEDSVISGILNRLIQTVKDVL